MASLAATVLGALGAVGAGSTDRRKRAPRTLPSPLAVAAAATGLLTVATAVLVRALLSNDFTYEYVADVSRRDASLPLRFAALWGGMAGSLLWFTTLLAIVGFVAAWRFRDTALAGLMVAMPNALTAGLIVLIAGWANPFDKLPMAALDGRGLTPVLEHPAMAYHPPLLYLGLTTLAAPCALALAALVVGPGRAPLDWLSVARRWLLVPWTLLIIGMVAGAHWAYVVLGWGGYWAWDPVENTALLPFLAATMALHSGLSRSATWRFSALVGLAFVLSLMGATLTRSGAAGSVHSFAESPAIGRGLLLLLVFVVTGIGVAVTGARRSPADPRNSRTSHQTSFSHRRIGGRNRRDRLLGMHLVVIGLVLAIATAGTLAPLIPGLVDGEDQLMVEGHYFTRFIGPLALLGLALIAIVPVVRRRHATAPIVGVLLGIGLLIWGGGDVDLPSLALAAAAGAAAASSVAALATPTGPRTSRWRSIFAGKDGGMYLAHASVSLVLLGVAGTASGTTEVVFVSEGETVQILDREITYSGVTVTEGPVADRSSSVVAHINADGRELRPSLDAYSEPQALVAESSLVSTPRGDLQVSLRDAADNRHAVLQIGVHPLQPLVWWGGLLLALSGVLLWGSTRRPRFKSAHKTQPATTRQSV